MQIHQIKPTTKNKGAKRVGRGGKKGTYSGKGMKGQKSRAGRKMVPAIRGIIKKYHKLRGYRFSTVGEKPLSVNLGTINEKFGANETVSPKSLIEKKVIRKYRGKIPSVKILGRGEIEKLLVFENCLFSKSAEEKIKKAKGKI